MNCANVSAAETPQRTNQTASNRFCAVLDSSAEIKKGRGQGPIPLAVKKVPTRTGPRCAPSACNPCRFAPDQRLHCSKSKVPNPKI